MIDETAAPCARPARSSTALLRFGVFLGSAITSLTLYRIAERWRRPSPQRALATLSRWCRWGCPWLRLQVTVEGTPPPQHCLYIANHRSYLDIPVLTSVLGATFLSRADVGSWPLIGTIAHYTQTVLVDRDDAGDRVRAARALLRRLRTASIVVFPEGTTTGTSMPAPFPAALFRVMQRLEVPIVPVTLRYSERRAYWVEDLTVWQHLQARVLVGAPLRVAVTVGQPLRGRDFADLEALAEAVHAAVCAPIERHGELA